MLKRSHPLLIFRDLLFISPPRIKYWCANWLTLLGFRCQIMYCIRWDEKMRKKACVNKLIGAMKYRCQMCGKLVTFTEKMLFLGLQKCFDCLASAFSPVLNIKAHQNISLRQKFSFSLNWKWRKLTGSGANWPKVAQNDRSRCKKTGSKN